MTVPELQHIQNAIENSENQTVKNICFIDEADICSGKVDIIKMLETEGDDCGGVNDQGDDFIGHIMWLWKYNTSSEMWLLQDGVKGLPEAWQVENVFKPGGPMTDRDKREAILRRFDESMEDYRRVVVVEFAPDD